MICQRCGAIGETFVTEGEGELCEACQRQVEVESPPGPRHRFRAGEGAEEAR